MFIIIIPWFLIAMLAMAAFGIFSNVLEINLMPYFSLICLGCIIVGIIKCAKSDDEKEHKAHVATTLVFSLFFIISLFSSCTAGEMLSCVWYNI